MRPLIKTLFLLPLFPFALALIYRFTTPPSTLMLAGWVTGQKVERNWVPLKQISPHLIESVLLSEDDAFCNHLGIDFTQLKKSLARAKAEKTPIKGTSTITQQLAKNLFLWQGRSWVRKIVEAPLALWLELTWPKSGILETYLNVVEWGPGVYGVQAAAHLHFGTKANNLSLYQSSLLATSLPNPIKRNASHPGPAQIMLSQELLIRLQQSAPDMSCLR